MLTTNGTACFTLLRFKGYWIALITSIALLMSHEALSQPLYEERISARLCIDPDWEPYEWVDEQGVFYGIAADLIAIIAEKADIDFELIITADWPESIEFARQNRCDVLGFLNKTPERSEWLDFTNPYFTDPNVFITRQDFEYIPDLSILNDVNVALPHGTSIEQHLMRNYPNLFILTFDTELDVLDAIRQGKADLAVRSLSVAAYLLRKEGSFDLKVAGELANFSNEFRMGVVKGNNDIVERINQGIAALTVDDVRAAVNRYVYIRVYQGFNYQLLFIISGSFILLIGLISFWTFRLKRLNQQLSEKEAKLQRSRDKLQQALDEEHLTNLKQHQFMRMVAHEFRTPLSVIESACDLLELKSPENRSLHSTIEKQRQSARYLADLVNRSLAEDRMIKTFWQRNAAEVSCKELIERTQHYASLLNQGNHTLTVECTADRLAGDIELLSIMLNNLVENAFKYSPAGGNIQILAYQNTTHITFTIKDEGIGIADTDQPIIFGKYQRGENQNSPGLGLGLYLVKAIANIHNGNVNYSTELNKGSAFTVTLPITVDNKNKSTRGNELD